MMLRRPACGLIPNIVIHSSYFPVSRAYILNMSYVARFALHAREIAVIIHERIDQTRNLLRGTKDCGWTGQTTNFLLRGVPLSDSFLILK